MNINEARKIVMDDQRSFTEKYHAVMAIVSSPDVQPIDLLDCLSVEGVSAEAAATKLHTLTGRAPDNGVLGIYLDRQNWEKYLQTNKGVCAKKLGEGGR